MKFGTLIILVCLGVAVANPTFNEYSRSNQGIEARDTPNFPHPRGAAIPASFGSSGLSNDEYTDSDSESPIEIYNRSEAPSPSEDESSDWLHRPVSHHKPYPQLHHKSYPRPRKCVDRKRAVSWKRLGLSKFSKNSLIGFIFPRPEPKTVAFYAFYNSKKRDWFYTSLAQEARDALNRGYKARGVAGWVFPNASCGGVPLYRLYYEPEDDHYYTTSLEDAKRARRRGWSNDGPVAYIFK